MRDMLDTTEPYPLTAWSAQFQRIRTDLDDALQREEGGGAGGAARRSSASTSATRWRSSGTPPNRIFDLARRGQEDEARAQIRLSLQARQAALSTAVARLLVAEQRGEEQTAQRVQDIYADVQRQVYWFLAATLVAIAATSAVPDPLEPAAVRAARRRSRSSGASWRSS